MGTAQDPELARLGDEYFQAVCAADPFSATVFGIAGYDAEVPDRSRAADERLRARLAGLTAELAQVDAERLGEVDRVSRAMLTQLLGYQQDTLRWGLDEVAVTASVAGVLAEVVSLLPTTSVAGAPAAQAYLSRLRKLGGFFDGLRERHLQAKADGRFPTALGVRQAIAQLDGYLATPLTHDPLLHPTPGPGLDAERWRAQAADLVDSTVRPALARYRTALAEELLPVGRADDQVGVCHLPDGVQGYLAHVRADTTTELSPEEIHETGLRLIATLREEFAERGALALGTSDVAEVLSRLREDPALRFATGTAIVDTVTDALRRAEEALPDWFNGYDIAPCVVREMDPAEAENSVLGYYMPPAADGSRPGTHVINTYQPQLRPRFEYEALAFHESVPGHHLQIGIAQSLTDLPDFRRFAFINAHGEGWGLYAERLCEEMGLYSDELSRLGMVSFDAWRASRLVVDTGMHYYGWSRSRAIGYLRENTALSETNIANEVDRYIADPGQALGYMVGRLRIRELRDRAQADLGHAFDIRSFHHQVLAHGPLPLDTLEDVVIRTCGGSPAC
jgi:uncharacterized protein (DUF885 family)